MALTWEQKTETSEWLKAHAQARLEKKGIDRDSSLASVSGVSIERSNCKNAGRHSSISGPRDQQPKQQRLRACTESDCQKSVTTIMIQNFPKTVSQRMLVDDLNRSEFVDAFDFCYVPTDFKTRLNKGFAFVNFSSPAQAESFKRLYDVSRRFGVRDDEASPRYTPAAVQGLDANVQTLQKGKMARIRSRDFRPYLRPAAS
jgi:RNA recognition motif-containing protein